MKTVEGWENESLGHVAQLTMGQSPESKYYSEEENRVYGQRKDPGIWEETMSLRNREPSPKDPAEVAGKNTGFKYPLTKPG